MKPIGVSGTFPIEMLLAAGCSPVDPNRVPVNGLDPYQHVDGVICTLRPFVIEALVI